MEIDLHNTNCKPIRVNILTVEKCGKAADSEWLLQNITGDLTSITFHRMEAEALIRRITMFNA